MDRCRSDAQGLVLPEVDRLVHALLIVVPYFCKEAVKVDKLLLLHRQYWLAVGGLYYYLEVRYHTVRYVLRARTPGQAERLLVVSRRRSGMDYDEQLDRALEETPDIQSSGSRFDVPDPTARQEGNVTVYENFQDTIDRLERDEDHVLKFLQDELGTSAHIDERGRARLTGEFSERRLTAVIESYVEAYVTCPECGLPDTNLVREQGVLLLTCDACGARSSVGEA
jgi:translation initiation factor 2 subunit 2